MTVDLESIKCISLRVESIDMLFGFKCIVGIMTEGGRSTNLGLTSRRQTLILIYHYSARVNHIVDDVPQI